MNQLKSPLNGADPLLPSFNLNGYVHVPNVFDRDVLEQMRSEFTRLDSESIRLKNGRILLDVYNKVPDLVNQLFNPNYLNVVRKILGEDIVCLPENALHIGMNLDWHRDTSWQEIAGVKSHINAPVPMLQLATYFQNNSDYGGGLTVISGSHAGPDILRPLYQTGLSASFRRLLGRITGTSIPDKLNKHPNKTRILSCCGDLVAFDLKLAHRSTAYPHQSDNPVKYSVYNTFGKDDQQTRDYLDFMLHRKGVYYDFLRSAQVPESLKEVASRCGFKVFMNHQNKYPC